MALFIGYIIVQFMVQCALYYSIKWLLILIASGVYFLATLITEDKRISLKISIKSLAMLFLASNIAISCAVKYFTSTGAASGLSNLGASAILGFLMAYHVYKFKKELQNENNEQN